MMDFSSMNAGESRCNDDFVLFDIIEALNY
jgi:hypothetical protein